MISNGIYHLRTFGDPILNCQTTEVEEFDGKLANTISVMKTFLDDSAIGLAAPQVGIQKSFFVWKVDGEKPKEIINPKIVDWGSGVYVNAEGCLSIPNIQFAIRRMKKVTIRGYNVNGKEVSYEGRDLKAALFQHEMDHLHGYLAINSPNFVRQLNDFEV